MSGSNFIRQGHRWLSIIFTLAVMSNFVAIGLGVHAEWIGFLALPPLFLLLFSGLSLFALPYLQRRRSKA